MSNIKDARRIWAKSGWSIVYIHVVYFERFIQVEISLHVGMNVPNTHELTRVYL